jgi:hypothetical protein
MQPYVSEIKTGVKCIKHADVCQIKATAQLLVTTRDLLAAIVDKSA